MVIIYFNFVLFGLFFFCFFICRPGWLRGWTLACLKIRTLRYNSSRQLGGLWAMYSSVDFFG
jgi:hypothetical protein